MYSCYNIIGIKTLFISSSGLFFDAMSLGNVIPVRYQYYRKGVDGGFERIDVRIYKPLIRVHTLLSLALHTYVSGRPIKVHTYALGPITNA